MGDMKLKVVIFDRRWWQNWQKINMCIVITMKKKKYPNLMRLCKCILPKERKTRTIIDTPVRAISPFWMTKHNISKASHCGLLGLARSNHDAIELRKGFFYWLIFSQMLFVSGDNILYADLMWAVPSVIQYSFPNAIVEWI